MKAHSNLCWTLCICCLCFSFNTSAQPESGDIKIIIKSEQKQLFSVSNVLKEIMDDHIQYRAERLKRSVSDWLRVQVKSRSGGQTMYSDVIKLSDHSIATLREENGRIFLQYSMTSNSVDFKVTTPEVLGVGLGQMSDPKGSIYFTVSADFELKQSGVAESIHFINPLDWKITSGTTSISNSNPTSLDKSSLTLIAQLMEIDLSSIFASLNGMNEKMNEYINSSILSYPDLLKEFSIDENKNLKAVADVAKGELIFQHSYSQTGIVKRTATAEAKTVKEGPKSTSTSTVPTSTSASEIKKKSNVTTSTQVNNTQVKKK